MDPAVLWRGENAPAPPGPWPSRHEAFLTACALFAGQREQDLLSTVEGLGESLKDIGKPGGFSWR